MVLDRHPLKIQAKLELVGVDLRFLLSKKKVQCLFGWIVQRGRHVGAPVWNVGVDG